MRAGSSRASLPRMGPTTRRLLQRLHPDHRTEWYRREFGATARPRHRFGTFPLVTNDRWGPMCSPRRSFEPPGDPLLLRHARRGLALTTFFVVLACLPASPAVADTTAGADPGTETTTTTVPAADPSTGDPSTTTTTAPDPGT